MSATEHDDLTMLKNPSLWPCWPRLPLKRRSKNPAQLWDVGFVSDGMGEARLFLANIYDKIENPTTVLQIEYPSPEALLADGWVVD